MRYLFFLALMLIFPTGLHAAEVSLFTSIPFLTGEVTTAAYIEALFNASIAIAAILVVIRLIWAGTEYMLSDLVTTKESARKKIRGALLGLLIILASVTILNTINPNLLNLDVIGKGEAVNITAPDVTDNIKLKVGELVTNEDIKWYCKNGVEGWLLGKVDEDCYSKALAAYDASCAYNGGRLEYTPWTLWALTGSTAWTCQAR